MRITTRTGGAAGLPIMKFTLTYDGELASSGNSPKPDEVWRMRKEFHPQLEELWLSHSVLKNVPYEAIVPERESSAG